MNMYLYVRECIYMYIYTYIIYMIYTYTNVLWTGFYMVLLLLLLMEYTAEPRYYGDIVGYLWIDCREHPSPIVDGYSTFVCT